MQNQDLAARTFLYTSVFWLVGGAAAFFLSATSLASPGFLDAEVFAYPRMRATASVALQFGWLQLAILGGVFFVLPRICGAPLRSETGGVAAAALINLAVLLGILLNLFAGVQGHEFGELPPFLFATLVFAHLLVAATVLRAVSRTETGGIYVSHWLLVGSALWTPIALVLSRIPVLSGVPDAIADLFGLNATLMLFFAAAGMGIAYYVVPRASGQPLYSHRLAMTGFWALAFAGPIAGESLRILGPSQSWLQSAAVAASIVLLIPAIAFAVNVFAAVREGTERAADNPSLRFIAVGAVLFLAASGLRAAAAFRSVSRTVASTEVITGTVWLFILGAFTLWALGIILFALPRLMGRRWVSARAIGTQLWVAVLGVALVVVSMWVSGALESAVLNAGVAAERPMSFGNAFSVVTSTVWRLRWGGVAGTLLILTAAFTFALNVLRSTTAGEERPIEVVTEAAVS